MEVGRTGRLAAGREGGLGDGRMDGWTEGAVRRTGGRTHGLTEGRRAAWMDGQIGWADKRGRIGAWMDECMEAWTKDGTGARDGRVVSKNKKNAGRGEGGRGYFWKVRSPWTGHLRSGCSAQRGEATGR